MLYYNHREHKKPLKKGGENVSVLIENIAQWEKAKKELANIDELIKEKKQVIFSDDFLRKQETELKQLLKEAFSSMN